MNAAPAGYYFLLLRSLRIGEKEMKKKLEDCMKLSLPPVKITKIIISPSKREVKGVG